MKTWAALLAVVCLSGGEYTMDWHTIDGGGGESSAGDVVIAGTIGQPDAGGMSGGTFTLAGGFWSIGGDATPCPADIDGSGEVDFSDLLAILAAWGPCGETCPEDIDGSGDVGFSDLLAVLAAWGVCP